ncbi:MAG: dockerin type I repeat-containing protein [Clostridia bacterium]|nr:dockerin type I repeat-containing protein [Clostridia bacterium]
MGDADGSGKVDATDARAVLRAAAKLDTLEADKAIAADVTGDNKIDATDARVVLRVAAKLDSMDAVPEIYKK